MEKQLKKTTGLTKFTSGICWVVCIAAATFCGVALISWVVFLDMYEYVSATRFGEMEINIWIAAVVSGIIAIILLVVILVNTGRLNQSEDGEIRLNWFDRIWSEIHIALLVLTVIAAFGLATVIYDEYWRFNYREFWQMTWQGMWGSLITEPIIELAILGLIADVGVFVACAASAVKKLKVHKFWEKSLIGGIIFWLVKTFKNSDSTTLKILGVIVLGVILSATWFGAPLIIILALIFLPKTINKFTRIKEGVAQVKNGNLSYKIPVETDNRGVKGELDRLAENINQISEASEIAVQNELKNQRMKTDLISNVSHDLKTPLTSMISYVDLLKTEGLDSENAPEYLSIIDQKTQRLKVLTENLFEAAKASSGAVPVDLKSIDVSAMVNQSLGEMDQKLAEHNLQIIKTDECQGKRVIADGQLLWRVLENLLGNISKYALDGSRVYINLKPVDDRVKIEIKNISRDSLNIPADELMERFKRGDESRNTEGSGLGLAIAKDLTKLMNGTFEISIDGDLFKTMLVLPQSDDVPTEAFQDKSVDDSIAENADKSEDN